MTRTDAFARDFCRRMKERRVGDYEWTCGGKPLGKGHESIDVMGKSKTNRRPIFVEIELRRGAPLTNVAKVWRKISGGKKFKAHFIFVQAFSRYYKKGDTRRSNAEFVGTQMQEITSNVYLPISFDYNPQRFGKQGGGRRRAHAYQLADKIRRELKSRKLVS